MSSVADSDEHTSATGVARPGAGSGCGSDFEGVAEPSADASKVQSDAAPAPRVKPASVGLVFDDPLDRPSSDDADRGWGDPTSGSVDDDFTRFLSEKPPHHF